MTVASYCIIKGLYVFEYQPVGMDIIKYFESVKPLSFDEGMEGLYTCVFPRKCLFGIAIYHFFCCF